MRRIIIRGGIILAAFFVFCGKSNAQVIELACPIGTTSVQALQTTDTVNGKIRQNYCVDVFGNVFQNVTGSLTVKALNNILYLDQLNIAGWAGTDIGAQMNSMCSALPASGGVIYYNPNGTSQALTTQVTDCGKTVTFLLDNPNITTSITAFWLQHNSSAIIQRSGLANNNGGSTGIAATASLPVGSPLILLQTSPANGNMQDNKLDGLRLSNGRNSRTSLIQAVQTINLQVSNILADGVSGNFFYTHAIELNGSFGDSVEHVHCNNMGNALGCVVIRSIENGLGYNSSNNTIKDVTSVSGAMVQANILDSSGAAPSSLDTTNIITGTMTSNGAPPAALAVSTYANSPASGTTTLNVQAGQGVNFHTGDPCILGDVSHSEENRLVSVSTDTLTMLFPSYVAHTSGERVICSTFGVAAGGNTFALKMQSLHLQDCADCVDLQGVQGFQFDSINVGATNTPIGDGIRCDPCRFGTINSPVYGQITNGLHVTNKSGSWLSQSRSVQVNNPDCFACTNDLQDDVSDASPPDADGISELSGNWPLRMFTGSIANVRRDASVGCSGASCQVNLYAPNTRLGTAGESLTFVGATSGTTTIAANAAAGNNTLTLPQNITGTLTETIASGTASMTTVAIAAGACGTTVTVAAANVLTTDTIEVAFNAAPAGTNAGLTQWPTAGNVNFAYCPGVAETPAAATINWKVVR